MIQNALKKRTIAEEQLQLAQTAYDDLVKRAAATEELSQSSKKWANEFESVIQGLNLPNIDPKKIAANLVQQDIRSWELISRMDVLFLKLCVDSTCGDSPGVQISLGNAHQILTALKARGSLVE